MIQFVYYLETEKVRTAVLMCLKILLYGCVVMGSGWEYLARIMAIFAMSAEIRIFIGCGIGYTLQDLKRRENHRKHCENV
jgi:hypothetical protein